MIRTKQAKLHRPLIRLTLNIFGVRLVAVMVLLMLQAVRADEVRAHYFASKPGSSAGEGEGTAWPRVTRIWRRHSKDWWRMRIKP